MKKSKMNLKNEEYVNRENISKAYERISKHLKPTPVHTSSLVDKLVGKNVFFKCENFQKTGSFKARGALNAVALNLNDLSDEFNGFVTHSSGNHGFISLDLIKNSNREYLFFYFSFLIKRHCFGLGLSCYEC
jgi:threonine synthase